MDGDKIIKLLRDIRKGYELTYPERVALALCIGKIMKEEKNNALSL